jgi:branched-chain amino acid transport system substrate-binding protein
MAHSELGINGVKIVFAECETGYATDRGLDCYERLKRNGPTGAAFVVPRSTGVTFLLTDRAYTDKIPLLTPGYGRAASKDGSVFMWELRRWGPTGRPRILRSNMSAKRSAA